MAFSTITSLRCCPCVRCFTSRRLPVPALLALTSCRLRTTHWIVASFVCASLAVAGRVLAQSQISTPDRPSELAAQQKADEIQIPLKNGATLKATLSIPKSTKLVPAVLIIPGYITGHRPRDEEAFRQPGEDSGTLLARYLLSQGFAVMRVPIGEGPNGNEPSLSITDLADRELDCIAYLKTCAEIDAKQIGIMGQSIGGFIGMAAAARRKRPSISRDSRDARRIDRPGFSRRLRSRSNVGQRTGEGARRDSCNDGGRFRGCRGWGDRRSVATKA